MTVDIDEEQLESGNKAWADEEDSPQAKNARDKQSRDGGQQSGHRDGPVGPGAICGNPLCRKRWKQLAELQFPVFCPACRLQAEALIPADLANGARWEALFSVWDMIAKQISVVSGLPGPMHDPMELHKRTEGQDCEEIFWMSFPKPPDRQVTTWNGMKKLRLMYRARIVSRFGYVIMLEPLTVLDPKTLRAGDKPVEASLKFYLVDWEQRHQVNQEVVVIAMPNPAKTERKYVTHIVKIPAATLNEDGTSAPIDATVQADAGTSHRRSDDGAKAHHSKQKWKGDRGNKSREWKGWSQNPWQSWCQPTWAAFQGYDGQMVEEYLFRTAVMNPNMALAQAPTPEQWGQWVAATGYPAPGQLPLAAASLMPGMAPAAGAPLDPSTWDQNQRRPRSATDPTWATSDGRQNRDARKAQPDHRAGKNAGQGRKLDPARNASSKHADGDKSSRAAQRGRVVDSSQQDPLLPVSPHSSVSPQALDRFHEARARSSSQGEGSPFSPGAIYPPTPSPGFPAAMPMPLPKLFDFERMEAEAAEGGRASPLGSSRSNPKAKAKPPSFSTMTPSPHYAGLHPGLNYMFGRPGSGEVIRFPGAKDGKRPSEEAAEDGDDPTGSANANEFDSLMGWANDPSDEPASAQSTGSSSKVPLNPLELPGSPNKKVPASPVRGSPSPQRQSPLQTIVEEKPDIEPPDILKAVQEKPNEEA
jgi:hypothetical protein